MMQRAWQLLSLYYRYIKLMYFSQQHLAYKSSAILSHLFLLKTAYPLFLQKYELTEQKTTIQGRKK